MNVKVCLKICIVALTVVAFLNFYIPTAYARTAMVVGQGCDLYSEEEDECATEIRQLFLSLADKMGYNPVDYHNNPNLERLYILAFRENRSIIWCDAHGGKENNYKYDGEYLHLYFWQTKYREVYDDQVWRHSEKGKMRFVFMWTCYSANYIGGLATLSNGSTVEIGFPYAWSRIDNLSGDGYKNPSSSDFCFIGFLEKGPLLTSNYTDQNGNQYLLVGYSFTKAFWQAVFNGKTIKQALDNASRTVFGERVNFGDCVFYKGANWGGDLYVKMEVYGNSNIELTSQLPTDIKWLGDLNWDGEIDSIDLTIIYSNLGSNPANPKYDLNKDGKINYIDLGLEFGYYLGWQTRNYTYAPPIETTATTFGQTINQIRQKYP